MSRSENPEHAYKANTPWRISEADRLDRQLAALKSDFSELVRRTIAEREAERQHIARELHDNLGQYLSAMDIELDALAREGNPTSRERVEMLKTLTADALREMNKMAWEIRPQSLDDQGLQGASEQFLSEWRERSTLQFDLSLTLGDHILPPAIETALYRVLQEAIRNVVKHAEAKRVGIILQTGGGEVRLVVEDDGKGFVWDEADGPFHSATGLGLLGIRERLALVDGTLEIESAPDRGTALFVKVPL